MNKEVVKNYLEIVEHALDKIYLAKINTDKRKLEKAISVAKHDAHDMVFPYKAELIVICNLEHIGEELFDWGHLESDLQTVFEKLKKILKEDKNYN